MNKNVNLLEITDNYAIEILMKLDYINDITIGDVKGKYYNKDEYNLKIILIK
jgi:hypothetical protein